MTTVFPPSTKSESDDAAMRRWTGEEYIRLARLGFFDGQRVELIDGAIIQMSPIFNPHAAAVSRLAQLLFTHLPEDRFWVRVQATLALHDNFPEPDIAVISGPITSEGDIPTSALLVIEVSDTTLRMDRGKKMSLYASAGIAEYWLVNLQSQQVEVHSRPIRDAASPFGWRYEQIVPRGKNETLSLIFTPALIIQVGQILS